MPRSGAEPSSSTWISKEENGLRNLLLSVAVASAAIVIADRGLGWYGVRHFLPEQRMATAIAEGDACILVLGDSRMASALDAAALHAALRERGADRCVADLALGATDISGAFVTARRYLASGRLPAVTVLGKVEDSLLDPDPRTHRNMVGNNALHLTWTEAPDVFDEVAGFPLESVTAFDEGLRFLVARATALGRYQSQLSVRVQAFQNRFTGRSAERANRFGLVGDMASLEGEMRARAAARLDAAVNRPGETSRWLERLLDLLAAQDTGIVVVELPMPSAYRREVTSTAGAAAYRAALGAELAQRKVAFVDLAGELDMNDDAFADALHLVNAGATRVSLALGRHLGGDGLLPVPRRRAEPRSEP